ncbi:MAG: cyclopropane-fatty-acyl-phospholipid synthase family protein [Rubripirellula sp.]
MIAVENIKKSTIRSHYQLGTVFYRLLWGPHIHHGLWEGDESAYQAQCQLTDTLADMAEIDAESRIVDIGCGMGGSAIRLATQRGCDVTGVTLSPIQRHWAAISSRFKRASGKTRFLAEDAEKVQFQDKAFDVVWSVECTEHLFDKPAFFQKAADWLQPGGRVAVCVWFEGADSSQPGNREQVEEVCRRFVCPSLGTREDYCGWMTDAGLRIVHNVDWTERAAKTWEICKRRVSRTGVKHLARFLDQDQVAFLDGFDTLLNAYRSGAMQYGAIVAEKPYNETL